MEINIHITKKYKLAMKRRLTEEEFKNLRKNKDILMWIEELINNRELIMWIITQNKLTKVI